MFEVATNPLFPMAVLLFAAGLVLGLWQGMRRTEDRIMDDVHCLGGFQIEGHTFQARCLGFPEESEDESGGEPRNVNDLLTKEQKNALDSHPH